MRAAHVFPMRYFESWWEHLPTIARVAPLVLALVALAFPHVQHVTDYYWE
jgi:hypothetical protein